MPQTKERSRATGSSRRNGRGGSPGTAGERRITARNTTAQERQFLDRNARWLSPSTLRAKWIHRPDEHEDRPGQTLATKDAEVIQAWATARRAKPATVGRREGDRPRTLRFDFPDYEGGRRLEPVDWSQWMKTFQERDLVFLFQEHRRNGGDSNFFRLDSPKRERG